MRHQTRRNFLKSAGVSAAALSISFSRSLRAMGNLAKTKSLGKRPNVIVILTDDQGYGDLACHGNPFIKTPNMDELYKQSIRLTNFHVSPMCAPTRAALMTGAHEWRSGVTHVGFGQCMLSQDSYTMANCFSDGGYKTAIYGKWHLGSNYPQRPQDKGFQETLNWWGAIPHQNPSHYQNSGTRSDLYLMHNGKWKKTEGFVTDVIFDGAMDWIKENKENPFFLFLPTSAPHGPFWSCPEEYQKIYKDMGFKSREAGFYGMVTKVDDKLGQLRKFLREQDLEKDTILVFLTDNGTDGGPRFGRYNAGMLGKKNQIHEGGTRVPCFVSWPGKFKEGVDVDQLSTHYDILPTLAHICGLNIPDGVKIDGISLAGWLKNPDKKWQQRYLCMDFGWFGPRYINAEPLKYGKCAVRNHSYRLINGEELYNVHEDPAQKNNIADQNPELVKKMRRIYEKWWKGIKHNLLGPTFIILGSEECNPTRLALWDWQPSTVSSEYGGLVKDTTGNKTIPLKLEQWLRRGDNEKQLNLPYRGSWAVEIARSGRYQVKTYIIPPESKEPIQLRSGKAYIRCGSDQFVTEIENVASCSRIEVELKKGKTYLEGWFSGQLPDNKICGALYMDIEYIGPSEKVKSKSYSDQEGTWPGYQPSVVLKPGQKLKANDFVVSKHKKCFCIMQNDGNFVIYKGSGPDDNRGFIWGTGTGGNNGDYFAQLTQKGHLEIYSKNQSGKNKACIWSSETASGLSKGDYLNSPGIPLPDNMYDKPEKPDYKVVLWDDGNLWSFSGEIEHNTGIKWSLN